jgi:tRNA U34 5-methylaminomethyl-2-thiouridine-forming methyltransferase MnmC
LSDFEIVTTSAGAVSIRNKVVNEIMHNPVGPWREANDLYIDQSRLRSHLTGSAESDFILFDVGLGAASNAIAAIHACLNLNVPRQRRLHVISFENNLELLRFTLEHAASFDHLRGFEHALQNILTVQHWESPCGRVIWDLRAGDFLDHIEREILVPELVFYDPYSPAVNQEMWTLECFKKLRRHCAPANGTAITTLYTYSVATPVRSAMLLAGFFVGHGIATGLKKETTQFSTHIDSLADPLSLPWFGRWVRSLRQLPYDVGECDSASVQEQLLAHPQLSCWTDQRSELIKAAFPGRKWPDEFGDTRPNPNSLSITLARAER